MMLPKNDYFYLWKYIHIKEKPELHLISYSLLFHTTYFTYLGYLRYKFLHLSGIQVWCSWAGK